MSLATATASSASTSITATAGPKISSRLIRMSLCVPVKIVGSTKMPVRVVRDRRGPAAGRPRRALVARRVEEVEHWSRWPRGDQRAHLRRGVQAAPEPDPGHVLGQPLDAAGRRRGAVDHQPGARGADLALVAERRARGAAQRGVEVGVGEDDVGRLAAQLQREPLHVGRRRALDRLADRGRAR